MSITQVEADYLISLSKMPLENDPIEIGREGESIKRELISVDRKERFFMDIWRSGVVLGKYTLQNRARTVIILVRVDVGDTLEHTNPDDTIVSGSHIHLYREGYDDKFASPLHQYPFQNTANIAQTLTDFARYCHIEQLPPIIQRLI